MVVTGTRTLAAADFMEAARRGPMPPLVARVVPVVARGLAAAKGVARARDLAKALLLIPLICPFLLTTPALMQN